MLYLFANCALDTDRRELRRADALVPLSPQVFDIIAYFVRNRDHVVSRDDLIDAVWGGRIVSESALTTRINAVRSAIGDSGEQQRLIKTLPRKGFRFVADVREQQASADAGRVPAAGVRAIVLEVPERPSIAVLPFSNMAADQDQDFLADGIVEDVITMLSHVSSLLVVARNSSFAFKGKSVDIREVGRELGVRYVLEGSVRRSGDRLRVTAQLIDASNGTHIWAERYDRTIRDVFAIQDDLTKEIVTALRIKLTDGEQASLWLHSTDNFEAWSLATRGADFIWRGTAADMAQARAFLERAVECDPHYAKATAMIALTYYFDVRFNYDPSADEAVRKHAEYTERALQLDPDDPYAVLMRSAVRIFEGRFAEALADVRFALAQSPGDAYCWVRYARILNNVEQPIEAEQAIKHAMRLNPFYPIYYEAILGDALLRQGRHEEAIAVFDHVLRRQPQYHPAYVYLASAYCSLSRSLDAGAAVAELLKIDPQFTLKSAKKFFLSSDEGAQRRFLASLHAAGLPE